MILLDIILILFGTSVWSSEFSMENDLFSEKVDLQLLLAQSSETESKSTNNIGLVEFTRLEQRIRELAAKYEDLDSQIMNISEKVGRVNQQYSDVKQSLNSLEATIAGDYAKQVEAQLDSIQNLRDRFTVLEDVLLKKPEDLSNERFELLEKRLSRIQSVFLEKSQVSDDEGIALSDLEARVSLIEGAIDSLLQKLGQENEPVKLSVDGKTLDKRADPSSSSLTDAGDESKQIVDEYNSAIMKYEKGEYTEAIELFEEFIVKHPDHSLAANAQYWIGDAYFSLKKYKLALKAQTKVLLRYQKSVKVADALLVIGSSHRELGNNEEARKAWSALIDKFPDTRLAIKARNRLENLPDSQF